MKVNWDHPKEIVVGNSRVPVAPGDPWEMPDDEALARLAAGEIGLNAHDPEEHARLLAEREAPVEATDQDAPSGATEGGTAGETPDESEAVSVAPRARRRVSASAPETPESAG